MRKECTAGILPSSQLSMQNRYCIKLLSSLRIISEPRYRVAKIPMSSPDAADCSMPFARA